MRISIDRKAGKGMEEVQLICVGYAGSTAANFNLLKPYFEGKLYFSAVEYRGRGTRSKEKGKFGNKIHEKSGKASTGREYCNEDTGYADSAELVQDVAEQVKKIRKKGMPYAILGYSMGAMAVYELFAQELLKESPVCVFIAAHEPPDVDCAGKGVDLADENAFLERVKIYGGLDERLLEDRRFSAIFLSRMRVDFRILKEYVFKGVYHCFRTRVAVLYCEEDTPYAVIRGWQRFAKKRIHFFPIGKSHFFFRTDADEFCSIILQEIRKALQESGEK